MTLIFADEEAADQWALTRLYTRGFRIKRRPMLPGEMTLRELGHITGLDHGTLSSRLRHPSCPAWTATLTGRTGRIIYLRASAAALGWLSRPLQPGAAL